MPQSRVGSMQGSNKECLPMKGHTRGGTRPQCYQLNGHTEGGGRTNNRTATMFFMFFKERIMLFCSLKNAFLCKMFFILMENGYFFTISVIT